MYFWMFYAILSAQKNFHPKFFWVKQGATQCYQAFLVLKPADLKFEHVFCLHTAIRLTFKKNAQIKAIRNKPDSN